MKEMRPLGSEKLTGDEKLKRILELTYWGESQKKQSIDKPEFVTESKIGGVYGIVKEKEGFFKFTNHFAGIAFTKIKKLNRTAECSPKLMPGNVQTW